MQPLKFSNEFAQMQGSKCCWRAHTKEALNSQSACRNFRLYTSLLHADTSPLSLAAEHRETEADLKASGVAHTILRNGWYAENYTDSIPGALAGGAFIGSAGEGRISAASRADFAEAAVAVLTGEGHGGQTYDLASDEAWTLAELAAEISNQTGRTIP